MPPEDLMNADMLSEILVLVSGSMIFVTLKGEGDEAATQLRSLYTGYHSAWRTRTASVRSQHPSVGQRPSPAGDH